MRQQRLSASSSDARVRAPAAVAAASYRPRYTSPRIGAAGPTPSAGGDGEGDGALGEAARVRVEKLGIAGGEVARVVGGGGGLGWDGDEG